MGAEESSKNRFVGYDNNVSRTSHLKDRINLSARMEAFNVFNKQEFGFLSTSAAGSTFGQVTIEGQCEGLARWVEIQGVLRF